MSEEQELFNVVVFYPNGHYTYEQKPMPLKDALNLAKSFTARPAAQLGFIAEVMITDMGDCCCFHWTKEKGIIFPTEKDIEKFH